MKEFIIRSLHTLKFFVKKGESNVAEKWYNESLETKKRIHGQRVNHPEIDAGTFLDGGREGYSGMDWRKELEDYVRRHRR